MTIKKKLYGTFVRKLFKPFLQLFSFR
jgi:hypothetical protein